MIHAIERYGSRAIDTAIEPRTRWRAEEADLDPLAADDAQLDLAMQD